jgi:hypothetical protein
MRAAARFEKRQVPSESQPQIASVAESRIKRMRSSLFCRASSAHVRIVLSSEGDMPQDTDIVGLGTSSTRRLKQHIAEHAKKPLRTW